MMARQLFGTDWVRGRAGHFLTADLALELARTAVVRLAAARPQVLIIRDMRESGEMLEAAIDFMLGCEPVYDYGRKRGDGVTPPTVTPRPRSDRWRGRVWR